MGNKWPLPGSQSLSLPSRGSKLNKPPAGSSVSKLRGPAQGREREGQELACLRTCWALVHGVSPRPREAGTAVIPFDRGGS